MFGYLDNEQRFQRLMFSNLLVVNLNSVPLNCMFSNKHKLKNRLYKIVFDLLQQKLYKVNVAQRQRDRVEMSAEGRRQ